MKKLKAALVGAGNRGQVYCDYAITEKDELEIISAVDPDPRRIKECREKYGIAEDMVFSSLDQFLAKNIECDFVVNATMDELHYETTMKLIDAGYNIILEKPVTSKYSELEDIWKSAEKKGVKILVCHVLRYTPYYRTIKSIINSGEIGDIISMEMNEHVWIGHFLDSFVRGKWNNEEVCGSGLLLAKCCHDTDLICWLNNSVTPEKVSSFGARSQFIPSRAPEGATEFCYNCPHNATCNYSAQKVHVEFDGMPFQTWRGINKPWQEVTKEEKLEFLKHDNYGRCAYNAGGDIVDRQVVTVKFDNGSIATLNLIGGCSVEDRCIHVVGTCGEIKGNMSSGKFTLTRFDRSEGCFGPKNEEIDINQLIKLNVNSFYGGHGGGDYALMHDAVRYFNGDESSISVTKIEDSVYGHAVVYAAEESRKTDRIVKLSEYVK